MSPFASINQAEVKEVVKLLGYAAAAAICTTLLNLVPSLHLSSTADVLVTSGLVPLLKFGVAFFSAPTPPVS